MTDDEGALIEWLGSATSGPEALGGKAASLDRLVKLGYRVPPGFCVTTAAFHAQETVDEPLRRAAMDLEAAIAASGVGEPRLAVRSSAIGEDGAAASYAGLHETELNVAPGDVPASVRRCWASLWSSPAVAYRTLRGFPDTDAAMAVVVQALVPAAASAVAFTRHPVTGRDDQLVLTTSRGLGDAMVSGTVTPDTYVIDRATRAVATYERGDDNASGAVDATALADLVDLCLRVERDFGRSVDIEAAWTASGWFLLQARPITTA